LRTSVLGQSGNGGDISVATDTLLLDTGLVQANTAAQGAKGGTISLNVQTLIERCYDRKRILFRKSRL
jgi:hypothetical protein